MFYFILSNTDDVGVYNHLIGEIQEFIKSINTLFVTYHWNNDFCITVYNEADALALQLKFPVKRTDSSWKIA